MILRNRVIPPCGILGWGLRQFWVLPRGGGRFAIVQWDDHRLRDLLEKERPSGDKPYIPTLRIGVKMLDITEAIEPSIGP